MKADQIVLLNARLHGENEKMKNMNINPNVFKANLQKFGKAKIFHDLIELGILKPNT